MPATPASEMAPSVSLSFANNFWGKEDAGVDPLLERMHNAKITSDELKSFYTQRAAIEEEYSRKILNLARKPLGSSEAGTLRMSMDVLRGELEAMGKSHQHIAQQMKGELEEPLSTFSGGIKERRKIIQNGIEKLLKTKTQQTHTVNKARDRYEQDCLKIKGYLAQGHMVMGQEERKNKAKLEKTQIQMSATSSEYEQAVKVLEETTARWNREWKAACDKFQDLEEERLDFTKSSLWSFANISSTVCVSDDASCEKIRLSLEDCDVEKDIAAFIKDSGTGQEIPDPPKYINFCRGDINDNASDVSDDANYSVAQFQRTMNPAFRSSSPQPSTYSSHHDPASTLAQEMTLGSSVNSERSQISQRSHQSGTVAQPLPRRSSQQNVPTNAYQEFPKVPHNEYPMDGMTQFCRLGPPSDRSSIPSPTRPEDDSHSEISNANSFSSIEPPTSPMKQLNGSTVSTSSQQDDKTLQKRRSGFFQNHSPFGRRKSKHENVAPASISSGPAQRNTWAPAARPQTATSPVRPPFGREATKNVGFGNDPMPSPDPEPVDPRANFQLNIGNNVFDVATPDARKRSVAAEEPSGELDPIAQALAELKGVRKQASTRVSADRYAGIPTPVPGAGRASPSTLMANSDARAGQRGTPPPSYDQPMRRLGAPQPAFTSKQMQQTTASYMTQKRDMFNAPPRNTPSQMGSRPASRGGDSRGSGEMMRSASPAPLRTSSPAPPRAISPRPSTGYDRRSQPMPQGQGYRSTSPNPYGGAPPGSMSAGRPRAQSSSPIKQQGPGYNAAYASHGNSPVSSMPRSASPNPQFRGSAGQGSRPTSSRGDPVAMAMQLAPTGDQGYPPSSRGAPGGPLRPTSTYYGAEGGWAAASSPRGGASQQQQQQAPPQQQQQLSTRVRSQSSAGQRQFTKDGRPILQFSRAMYMYQAAIPEELTFAKGDILAVLRLQDDGWWEAEVAGKDGRRGLVPSNYLVAA